MNDNEINELRAETLQCDIGGDIQRDNSLSQEARCAASSAALTLRLGGPLRSPKRKETPTSLSAAESTVEMFGLDGQPVRKPRKARKVARKAGYNGLWWLVGGKRYVRHADEEQVAKSSQWLLVAFGGSSKGRWVNVKAFRLFPGSRKVVWYFGIDVQTLKLDRRPQGATFTSLFPDVAIWAANQAARWAEIRQPKEL